MVPLHAELREHVGMPARLTRGELERDRRRPVEPFDAVGGRVATGVDDLEVAAPEGTGEAGPAAGRGNHQRLRDGG